MSNQIPADLMPLVSELRRWFQALAGGYMDWSSPNAPWMAPSTPGHSSARTFYMWRDSQRRFKARQGLSRSL